MKPCPECQLVEIDDNRHFCSKQCASKKGVRKIQAKAKARRVTITCKICPVEFEVPYSERDRVCCSKKCANVAKSIASTQRMIENNPMKRPEVAARTSKTRSEKFQNEPEFREQARTLMLQAWVDGKYDGVRVGVCEWYDHVKPDGALIKLQGTWELAYT